jgi:ribosome maturation protein Sdo1
MLGVAAEEDDDNDVYVAPASVSPSVSAKLLSEEQIAKLMAVAPLDSNGEVSERLKIAITAKSGAKTKIKNLSEIPPEKYEVILNWLPTVKLE